MTSGAQVERLLWAAAEARRLRVGDERPQAADILVVDDFVTEWQVGPLPAVTTPEASRETPPVPVG